MTHRNGHIIDGTVVTLFAIPLDDARKKMLAARQYYKNASNPGPPDNGDVVQRSVPMVGGPNPFIHEEWLMTRGRHLGGFGDPGPAPGNPDAPGYGDGLTQTMEDADDVEGSGIFDSSGKATVNRTLGVFQDHPSMPGWISRHMPFNPNPEVKDIWGAQVVEVPTGGLLYVDRGENLGLMAGGDSSHSNVSSAGSSPALPRGPGWPPRVMMPPGTQPRPSWTRYHDAPSRAQTKCFQPAIRTVPMVNTANVAVQRMSIGAAPEEQTPKTTAPGWGTYAFVGLLVGSAAAMVYGTTQMKIGSRR